MIEKVLLLEVLIRYDESCLLRTWSTIRNKTSTIVEYDFYGFTSIKGSALHLELARYERPQTLSTETLICTLVAAAY